ncbi:MAG TPA: sigma factor, partial [Desulfatiglandales bacterium]|nr:sigma factor [Desulfatiglandales bacterium]
MRPGINKYQHSICIEQGKLNEKTRDELVLKHAHLVKYIADRIAIKLPPNISKEELISAGIVGLLDSLDKFDSEMGIKFQTYAEHRIKGA